MLRWMVCYTGMGNTISVAHSYMDLADAKQYVMHMKGADLLYFIIENAEYRDE